MTKGHDSVAGACESPGGRKREPASLLDVGLMIGMFCPAFGSDATGMATSALRLLTTMLCRSGIGVEKIARSFIPL